MLHDAFLPKQRPALRALALLVLSLGGCEASLSGNMANEAVGSGSPDDPTNESGERDCAPRLGQDLLLLGELAFVNSVKALVGDQVAEGRIAPEAQTKIFSQKGLIANTSLVSTRLNWAVAASEEFDERATESTGCSNDDVSCARDYLAAFIRRAYRRPVSDEEVDDLMTVFEQGNETSFEDGIKLAVQAVIVSPSFNHRTEYGTMQDDGTLRLTPHEVASALSYLLTDGPPDALLSSAADAGALSDKAEIERQTLRLLEDEGVRDSVEKTLLSAWNLGNLFGKVKDPGLYPEFSASLASQMYHETELFLKAHVWDPAKGLTSVLSSRDTFINAALADLYDVPFEGDDPNAFVPTRLPESSRAGLFTQASFLTSLSRTDNTSVVARGLFVNGGLLCFPKIPSPPEDAIAAVEEQLAEDLTERERAQARAETVPCKNCHAQFDAFGLMLEPYDAIGRFRELEEGAPIDPGMDLSNKGVLDGYYANVGEFADTVADGSEFVQCVTRHFLAYATGENGLTRDDCEVHNATLEFTSSTTLTDVLIAVTTSDAFSQRVAEVEP